MNKEIGDLVYINHPIAPGRRRGMIKDYRGRNSTFPEEYLVVFPDGSRNWFDFRNVSVETKRRK
jgi:hypothetical protein